MHSMPLAANFCVCACVCLEWDFSYTFLVLACFVLIFLSSFLVFGCRWNLLFSFFFSFCFLCHLLLYSRQYQNSNSPWPTFKKEEEKKNEGSWIYIFVGRCWALMRGSLLAHLPLRFLITHLTFILLCYNLVLAKTKVKNNLN